MFQTTDVEKNRYLRILRNLCRKIFNTCFIDCFTVSTFGSECASTVVSEDSLTSSSGNHIKDLYKNKVFGESWIHFILLKQGVEYLCFRFLHSHNYYSRHRKFNLREEFWYEGWISTYSMAEFWGEVWGGVHLSWDRFAPPLKIFAPPLKSHAPPLEEVSMVDQNENVSIFGCLGSTLREKVFL
jgi:hypothetical protein